MTRKALARRIAEPYLTSQQRREAPAPPQPEGLRGFWPGALLLVSQRPQRVFSFLAPRTQPKFAAALLYEPQTWCTRSPAKTDFHAVAVLKLSPLRFLGRERWRHTGQFEPPQKSPKIETSRFRQYIG